MMTPKLPHQGLSHQVSSRPSHATHCQSGGQLLDSVHGPCPCAFGPDLYVFLHFWCHKHPFCHPRIRDPLASLSPQLPCYPVPTQAKEQCDMLKQRALIFMESGLPGPQGL